MACALEIWLIHSHKQNFDSFRKYARNNYDHLLCRCLYIILWKGTTTESNHQNRQWKCQELLHSVTLLKLTENLNCQFQWICYAAIHIGRPLMLLMDYILIIHFLFILKIDIQINVINRQKFTSCKIKNIEQYHHSIRYKTFSRNEILCNSSSVYLWLCQSCLA